MDFDELCRNCGKANIDHFVDGGELSCYAGSRYPMFAPVSAQGSEPEFPPLVDFEPHKSGGVTAIVGGFSFRAANEGEAGSRLRKYLVAECMKLPSKFTAEEQLANLKRAISASTPAELPVPLDAAIYDLSKVLSKPFRDGEHSDDEIVREAIRLIEELLTYIPEPSPSVRDSGEGSDPSASTGEGSEPNQKYRCWFCRDTGQEYVGTGMIAGEPTEHYKPCSYCSLEAKDAEIAKLEQTIADQKKRIAALDWIKITDDPKTLPEVGGEYWGFMEIECNGQHSTRQDTVYFGIGRGWRFTFYGRDVRANVTHWAPLPAPPAAEQTETRG